MECSCFHSRIKSNPFFLALQGVEVKSSLPVPGKTVPLLSLGENSNSKFSSVKVYWCHLTDTGENKWWHLALDLSAFHFTLILVIVGSSVLPAPSHKVVNQPPYLHMRLRDWSTVSQSYLLEKAGESYQGLYSNWSLLKADSAKHGGACI